MKAITHLSDRENARLVHKPGLKEEKKARVSEGIRRRIEIQSDRGMWGRWMVSEMALLKKSKMSTCCLSSGKVVCKVCWHSVGFPWKESSNKSATQGGVDKLRWLQPRGRRRGSGLAIMYCFVSSQLASEPVTAAVCVVVVVVKVAGSTQSWFSV